MNADHVKERLHDALHRGSHKATEEELAEVAAVVLAIVGEVTAVRPHDVLGVRIHARGLLSVVD